MSTIGTMRLVVSTALILMIYGCAKSPAISEDEVDDSDTSESFAAGPVTPPEAECEGDAYVEGDCAHPCVAESCEGGWCRIPSGCFIYGSPEEEWHHGTDTEVETPLTFTHDFVIQQHEMTRKEWAHLGFPVPQSEPDATGFTTCMEDDCPTDAVDWWEAAAAANRLSELHDLQPCYELTGCVGEVGEAMVCDKARALHASVYDCPGYRLPTLAEWEYAAKAGTRTSFYSGDITVNEETFGYSYDENLDPIAWYWWNSGPGTDPTAEQENAGKTTHPVERKQPNLWHLHDMSGNIAEWTWDRFSGGGFGGTPQTDPLDDGIEERHATRGGAAFTPSVFGRSAKNLEYPANTYNWGIGLRLVRTVSWPEGADTDTTEDTDTGDEPIDTDVDHDPADCPLDSGWPCTCYLPEEDRDDYFHACDDDSACAYVSPQYDDWNPDYGVCAVMCHDIAGDPYCDPTAFDAEPSCELSYVYTTAGLPEACLLRCTDDYQCPSDQRCLTEDFFGPGATEGFCYPYP